MFVFEIKQFKDSHDVLADSFTKHAIVGRTIKVLYNTDDDVEWR